MDDSSRAGHRCTQEVQDFLAVSDALFDLLEAAPDDAWSRPTQFKNWSIDDILGHLHLWNVGADLSLGDVEAFERHVNLFRQAVRGGESRPDYTRRWLGGVHGKALRDLWRDFYSVLASRFAEADPRARVPWVGPAMSVRSSISARLMETWAHAQAVYDLLGVDRQPTDAIRSIAHLGVNTRIWSFTNRGRVAPDAVPYVELRSPSGARWQWNDSSAPQSIKGSAFEFCQVVSQVRHVQDTALQVVGAGAQEWMAIAQCFAGEPVEPPAPGTRFKQSESVYQAASETSPTLSGGMQT